jgi:hypothetical protein
MKFLILFLLSESQYFITNLQFLIVHIYFSRQNLKLEAWTHPGKAIPVTRTITTLTTAITIQPDACIVTKPHPWAMTKCAPSGSQENL